MLDMNVEKILAIEAATPKKEKNESKALLLRACNVYVFSNGRIYSEFEEQTFSVLNDNNGCGVLDIEFVFENGIVDKNYPKFYTKCFVVRTSTGKRIKPIKYSNEPSCSKINQNGELVIGIRYYFRDEKEIENIITCKNLLVEGFVALDKPTNVFGVMCQLEKGEESWEISYAYTYKPPYAKNIKGLID